MQRFILLCFIALCCASCSGFVQDIRRPIDLISDASLSDESQADFLIRGVQAQFSESYSDAALYAGGLSDELFFDARTGAGGLVVYEEVDNALTIDRSNTTLVTVQNRLGRYRFHADDLAQRAGKVSFSQDSSRRRMAFQGNFHGAVARYFYAAYVGINKQQGGGVIDNGAFIPSTAMNDSALAKLALATQNVTSPYEARLVQTLAARIHLMERCLTCCRQINCGLMRVWGEMSIFRREDSIRSISAKTRLIQYASSYEVPQPAPALRFTRRPNMPPKIRRCRF